MNLGAKAGSNSSSKSENLTLSQGSFQGENDASDQSVVDVENLNKIEEDEGIVGYDGGYANMRGNNYNDEYEDEDEDDDIDDDEIEEIDEDDDEDDEDDEEEEEDDEEMEMDYESAKNHKNEPQEIRSDDDEVQFSEPVRAKPSQYNFQPAMNMQIPNQHQLHQFRAQSHRMVANHPSLMSQQVQPQGLMEIKQLLTHQQFNQQQQQQQQQQQLAQQQLAQQQLLQQQQQQQQLSMQQLNQPFSQGQHLQANIQPILNFPIGNSQLNFLSGKFLNQPVVQTNQAQTQINQLSAQANQPLSQTLENLVLENVLGLLSDVKSLKELREQEKSKSMGMVLDERQRAQTREMRMHELEMKLKSNEYEGLTIRQKLMASGSEFEQLSKKHDEAVSKARLLKQENVKLNTNLERLRIECENQKIELYNSKSAQSRLEKELSRCQARISEAENKNTKLEDQLQTLKLSLWPGQDQQNEDTTQNLASLIEKYATKVGSLTDSQINTPNWHKTLLSEVNKVISEMLEKQKRMRVLQEIALNEKNEALSGELFKTSLKLEQSILIKEQHEKENTALKIKVQKLEHALQELRILGLNDEKGNKQDVNVIKERLHQSQQQIANLSEFISYMEYTLCSERTDNQTATSSQKDINQLFLRYKQTRDQLDVLMREFNENKMSEEVAGKERSLLDCLSLENSELKIMIKNLKDDLSRTYQDALEKVAKTKDLIKMLLGWEIIYDNGQTIKLQGSFIKEYKSVETVLLITRSDHQLTLTHNDFVEALCLHNNEFRKILKSSQPFFIALAQVRMNNEIV